mmetsp:Transcript_19741/g.33918  ORF Transcript_19741/g.33918 Transcript_19741/m.33918 type:complete len:263 (+) Transcript_19741:184-972(+)
MKRTSRSWRTRSARRRLRRMYEANGSQTQSLRPPPQPAPVLANTSPRPSSPCPPTPLPPPPTPTPPPQAAPHPTQTQASPARTRCCYRLLSGAWRTQSWLRRARHTLRGGTRAGGSRHAQATSSGTRKSMATSRTGDSALLLSHPCWSCVPHQILQGTTDTLWDPLVLGKLALQKISRWLYSDRGTGSCNAAARAMVFCNQGKANSQMWCSPHLAWFVPLYLYLMWVRDRFAANIAQCRCPVPTQSKPSSMGQRRPMQPSLR